MNYLSCAFVFQSRGRPLSCFMTVCLYLETPTWSLSPKLNHFLPSLAVAVGVQESPVKHDGVYPGPSSKENLGITPDKELRHGSLICD